MKIFEWIVSGEGRSVKVVVMALWETSQMCIILCCYFVRQLDPHKCGKDEEDQLKIICPRYRLF